MKTKTSVSTTHSITLDPEEWFTVRLAGDRVASIDSLTATQHGQGGNWEINLHGSRVRKDGSFGQRMRSIGTWDHSRSFGDEARHALFAAVAEPIRDQLASIGVFP